MRDAIETIARAISGSGVSSARSLRQASSVVSALEDAGLIIAPREPTPEMAGGADVGTAQRAINTALAALGIPLAPNASVTKTGTGYGGPGRVCGVAIAEDGSPRIIVAHKLEGGSGRLMHIYSKAQIVAGGENA